MKIRRKIENRTKINCLYKLQSTRPPVFTFPSAAPMLWFHSVSCTPAGTPPAGASYTLRALESLGRAVGRCREASRDVEMVEKWWGGYEVEHAGRVVWL
jgi:hypothetical protein